MFVKWAMFKNQNSKQIRRLLVYKESKNALMTKEQHEVQATREHSTKQQQEPSKRTVGLEIIGNKANGEALMKIRNDGFIIFRLVRGIQPIDDPIVVIFLPNRCHGLVGRRATMLTTTKIRRAQFLTINVAT
jgi:hypothetical protein